MAPELLIFEAIPPTFTLLPPVFRSRRVRVGVCSLAVGLLLTAACQPDKDVVVPGDAEGPAPAPTPYALVAPHKLFPAFPNTPNNPLTVEGVELGRHLFYEKQLSGNGTQSCGSCHQQSKAFTDGLAHAIGADGGAPHRRNTMSLANVVWETNLTWDGAGTSLEQQARIPLENPVEMHQPLIESVRKLQGIAKYPPMFRKAFGSSKITEDNVLKALAQFERTLISGNSRYDRYAAGDKTAILPGTDEFQGLTLFNSHAVPGIRGAECFHCHTPVTFTSPAGQFFNNGLDMTFADPGRGGITGAAVDMGAFKAPTLRNVALTAPYMHDGRFQTLMQVLDHYSDHVQLQSPNLHVSLAFSSNNSRTGRMDLTADEKRQLVAFLHTLTDSTFIKDPRFAAPN
ncbi:cytochrome-c peroxidase [Hymenobacter busanensis]|uniref:Cytochrome-c peroxidase n=1 Tax=Hymenobacter busanensis TaxID=2607656 RepID=A0A7L4ZY21_9BACT|nr:cytochrome c peroxidase [Hymenobacter busanensis]KAA9339116.1 cytochrome-c peroxidase [Hymenobacter busanensis]QHJ07122.1 cytochrome-c peroxidase [Hymenobacter busanensis]